MRPGRITFTLLTVVPLAVCIVAAFVSLQAAGCAANRASAVGADRATASAAAAPSAKAVQGNLSGSHGNNAFPSTLTIKRADPITVAYCFDATGSMVHTFREVREEITRSIAALRPAQWFVLVGFAEEQVVMFNGGARARARRTRTSVARSNGWRT